MKNLIKILAVLLIGVNASCQVTTTLPIETLHFEAPNGAYLKDMDNKFPFWIDTWEGTVNNKKYIFTILMFQQHLETYPNGEYLYEDLIVSKLKVIDLSTNAVLHDESSYTNYDDFVIKGLYVKENIFFFGLFDKENHCNNDVNFIFEKNPNNPNQITYKGFSYDEYQYWDCPYTSQEDIPMFLPKVDLVLTRQ